MTLNGVPLTRNRTVDAAPARQRFVWIATTSYSGATLLAVLLGSHPDIATIGEMNGIIPSEDPERYICSCGERIRACGFWNDVAVALRRLDIPFDVADFGLTFGVGGPRLMRRLRLNSLGHAVLDRARDELFLLWPPERAAQRRLAARNRAFIAVALELTGASVFVDTSKDVLRIDALDRFTDLDVSAIHLTRDVRGVVASRLSRGVPISAADGARQWARHHARVERRLARLPQDRQMRVRYEDLCRRPADTLAAIYRFCGVSQPDAGRPLDGVQHVVGNPMRLARLEDIRLDERWRSLPADQLAAIDRVAADARHRFGYDDRGAAA